MSLMFIAMIVIIVILVTKNNNLKKENEILKQKEVRKISFCPECGFNLNGKMINFCPKCGHSFIAKNNVLSQNYYKKEEQIKSKPTDKEIKNSSILIVGSLLVVFASIIFLTSTWNITHNIIKTGVLIFMLAMFLAMSYISDKKFNLKLTSKTFYYIALAYIPIVLFSISLFSLFGNYLSLYGEGKYIYLVISNILVSIIYYLNSKKINSRLIFVFSILFQVLSVIFLVLVFSNDFYIVLFGLLIYSIVLVILKLLNINLFNEHIHKVVSLVISISVCVLIINGNLFRCLFNKVTLIDIFAMIGVFINLYLILIKSYNKNNIYKYLYPILIILIFNSFRYMFDNYMFGQSLIFSAFSVIYMYNVFRENKINIITYVEILISFVIFSIIWTINSSLGIVVLDSWILFALITVFNLVNYMFDTKYKYFSSSALAMGMMALIISLTVKFNLPISIIGLGSFILILISMFIKIFDLRLRQTFKWIGLVFLGFIILINYNIDIWTIVLYFVCFLITLIYSLINKNDVYKFVAYVLLNVVLMTLAIHLNINVYNYIVPFTTILITLIELFIPSIRSKSSNTYLSLSNICSLIFLNSIQNIPQFSILIILVLVFIFYIYYYKKDRKYLLIPLLGVIPYIYFGNILIFCGLNIMYFLSVIILGILCGLIYKYKKNFYITMFYIFSVLHILNLEDISYVSIIILIGGSLACYLIKTNKVKDLYKAILYILGLSLYNTIINDLNINNISALSIGIYLILTLLLTRTILKKYGYGYKVWEYVLCSLINLIVILNYTSQFDGIIYCLFLTIVVIICYILRYGPVFLICLISILLNVILLIGSSMPWWIYILIIGFILIIFAIHNEVKDKKDNSESLKKYLDL